MYKCNTNRRCSWPFFAAAVAAAVLMLAGQVVPALAVAAAAAVALGLDALAGGRRTAQAYRVMPCDGERSTSATRPSRAEVLRSWVVMF